MSEKDFDKIASIEKAIKEKYGEEAIANPHAGWDEEKEKLYLNQMKEMYDKIKRNEEYVEKIDINGIKVSKKLLNREHLRSCPVCSLFPSGVKDDVCITKFKCCHKCYIQYVDGREERWEQGWRPQIKKG